VNETEFKAKLPNNPENLRNCSTSSFCSKPQPRHKLNPSPELTGIVAGQRYVLFYQCLPGCGATTKYVNKKSDRISGAEENILIKTDKGCWSYGVVKASLASVSNLNTTNPSPLKTKETQDSGKHHVLECENIRSSFSIKYFV
jgi:hypothetical protein